MAVNAAKSLSLAHRYIEGEGEPAVAGVQVQEEGKARARSAVALVREVDAASGATLLRLSCALWVYNCSGLPVALQRVGPATPAPPLLLACNRE